MDRIFGVLEIMIPGNFNNSPMLTVVLIILLQCVALLISILFHSPYPPFRSQHTADRQIPLLEWCVSNNWVTLLPTISWMAWVSQDLGKCEPWISIVCCTLSSNLFVCTQQWQPVDPSHILYQCGVIIEFEHFNGGGGALEGPSFVWGV